MQETMLNHFELVELFTNAPVFEARDNRSQFSEIKNIYFPTTPNSFQFEKEFPIYETFQFMSSNWSLAFGIAGVYLFVIFGLQKLMEDRKALSLRWSLFMWNWIIGLASLGGFLKAFPELWKFVGRTHGFYESICIPNFTDTYGTVAILFVLSKIPELVDTVFVVLKKKPVEAVQWYHHVVTMVGAWICAAYCEPVTRYMVTINCGVHSLMYPYFALKVIGVKVPRRVAKFITTCQFLQMLICFVANMMSAYYYLSGTRFCHRHPVSLVYILVVNVTFIWMFGNLFLNLVLKKSRATHPKEGKQE